MESWKESYMLEDRIERQVGACKSGKVSYAIVEEISRRH